MDVLLRALSFGHSAAASRGESARLVARRLFLAAALVSPVAAFADTGTLTDDACIVTQSSTVDVRGPVLVVSGRPVSVAYIRFEATSALPAGTTQDNVAKATLRLYASKVAHGEGGLTVSRVTGEWDETTLTPATVLALTPEVSGVVVTQAKEFVAIDVTQLVKDWISGSQPNDGLALAADDEDLLVAFDSKESTATSHQPTLEISLTAEGPAGPPGPQGPEGPAGQTGSAGPQGPRGLNWRGAWGVAAPYVVDDAVSFTGSSWRALRVNVGVQPVEGDDWTIVAQRGEPGSGNVSSVSGTSPIAVSNPTTTPTISLGVVPATNGGTGLVSPGADGAFLRSAGGAWTSAPLSAPDVPPGSANYIQNSGTASPGQFNITGTGAAAVLNAGTQYNIAGNGVLSNRGTDNLFAGALAGINNNQFLGGHNTFLGYSAGFSNAGGDNNTYVGSRAGAGSAEGGNNTFVGYVAGANTTTGSANAYFGKEAGFFNQTGGLNAFFGNRAGVTNTTGNDNSFFGGEAGGASTVGNGNAFFGARAGNDNRTGSNNVFIGADSGNPDLATQVSNSVAIGTNAVVTTSNTIVLGTTAQVTQIPGQLEVDGRAVQSFSGGFKGLLANNVVVRQLVSGPVLPSPSPVCFRVVNVTGSDGGYGLTTCTTSSSSMRDQTDLEPYSRGLEVVNRLRPTVFTGKASGEREIGLVAEEVAEVEPLFTYKNEKDEVEGVKYPNLGAVFVNAIKEQQAQLAAQEAELRELRARLRRQEEQLAALASRSAAPPSPN
jgi:Chaperone of endosialidase